MMKLPEIPDCKKWKEHTTPEQDVLMKIQLGKQITKDEIEILDCAYQFYRDAFDALKAINLSKISPEEGDEIVEYFKNVVNLELIFQNQISIGLVYRMSWVKDYNEENGKVRNPNFLSYKPLDVVQRMGELGRANTTNSTCLYLAENAQVAVFECKPNSGDRIILTAWSTKEETPLIFYPVNTSLRVNVGVKKATDALDAHLYDSNQYFARMIKIIQEFIGSEFVKDGPITSKQKFEYLYSAYFADKVMNSKLTVLDEQKSPVLGQYDGIIYPSIATSYNFDNIAVRPESVDKLTPLFCHEYLVEETGYDTFNWSPDHLPFKGKLVRKSISIEDRIVWDDD